MPCGGSQFSGVDCNYTVRLPTPYLRPFVLAAAPLENPRLQMFLISTSIVLLSEDRAEDGVSSDEAFFGVFVCLSNLVHGFPSKLPVSFRGTHLEVKPSLAAGEGGILSSHFR